MIVDAAMGAAFDRVEAREREAQTAFEPGLPERAYAIVNDGRGGAIYTREGGFSIRDGRVVDDSGRAVLGTTRAGSTLSELRVDGTDLALGRVRDLQVGTDGRVTYRREAIDPRSGAYGSETVVVGRIALARFPIATAMRPVDANHVGAPVRASTRVSNDCRKPISRSTRSERRASPRAVPRRTRWILSSEASDV